MANISNKWMAFMIISCMAVVIPLSMVTALLLMPSSYWFEYHSVRPVKESFRLGESLEFVSVSQVYRKVNFEWRDILFCDFGDGFAYYSHYPSGRDDVMPRGRQTTSRWFYQGVIPNYAAQCYLESNISHVATFGIEKHQKLVGPFFTFK